MNRTYNKLNQWTNKKKMMISIILTLFVIWQAIWIFPLKYESLLIDGLFLISYIYIGIILGLLQKMSKKTALVFIPIINLVGLGFRILIEWGEVSITQELSLISVLTTYIPVIVLIYGGYLYAFNYLQKSNIYEDK